MEYKIGDVVKVLCNKDIYKPYPDFNVDMMEWKKKPMKISLIWYSKRVNKHFFNVEENGWTWVIDDIFVEENMFDDILEDLRILWRI